MTFDELKEKNIISDYYLFKWKGAVFDTIENSGDRVAGFTVEGNTLNEVRQKHDKAIARMRVLDVDGKDMMRKDLFEEF